MTSQDKGGCSPLHRASQDGFVDLARFLISTRQPRTRTGILLHAASQNGYVDIARILSEHGADVIAQDQDGWTPLHWASMSEDVDLAQILVEYGADATAQDKNGWTPLRQAV